MTILMGSYSSPESAHVVYFKPPTTAEGTDGKLVVGPSHKLGQSASWFAQHPKHADVVYGVLEKEPEDGEIVQVRLGQDAKEAKVEGTRSTLGAAPYVPPCDPASSRWLAVLTFPLLFLLFFQRSLCRRR
jgi:hypothetical protein